MTAYRRELNNPVYYHHPKLSFNNGGYGAIPTSQVPYILNEGRDMCYPHFYHALPCAFGQDPLQRPWNCSIQATSAVQWPLKSYIWPPDYLYVGSNYCCGPSTVSYNTPVDLVMGVDGSSPGQIQPVTHAPFVAQFPTIFSPSPSASRQKRFLSTIPRKVHITRQAKYGWNFSNVQLHSLVECCIARKRDADGNPTSLRTFSSQLENIENPRARDGTYKGYAILTFKNSKAAKDAVDALNHEGHFSAKIDKDQLPASQIPYRDLASRTVYVWLIPSHYSQHFFWGLIEECIPSSFATISACGIPIYDSIETIDFPTRVDGTSEGYAHMKFSSEVVANIVVGALQVRGFNAYIARGEVRKYCQAVTETQSSTQNSRSVWPFLHKGAPQAVPRPKNPRGLPKAAVAEATKITQNQAIQNPLAVRNANTVCHLPHVQLVDNVQATTESPISPILGLFPSSPVPRSASVADGYGSWYNPGSAVEEGRRSV